jgi:hypothetical protein
LAQDIETAAFRAPPCGSALRASRLASSKALPLRRFLSHYKGDRFFGKLLAVRIWHRRLLTSAPEAPLHALPNASPTPRSSLGEWCRLWAVCGAADNFIKTNASTRATGLQIRRQASPSFLGPPNSSRHKFKPAQHKPAQQLLSAPAGSIISTFVFIATRSFEPCRPCNL